MWVVVYLCVACVVGLVIGLVCLFISPADTVNRAAHSYNREPDDEL